MSPTVTGTGRYRERSGGERYWSQAIRGWGEDWGFKLCAAARIFTLDFGGAGEDFEARPSKRLSTTHPNPKHAPKWKISFDPVFFGQYTVQISLDMFIMFRVCHILINWKTKSVSKLLLRMLANRAVFLLREHLYAAYMTNKLYLFGYKSSRAHISVKPFKIMNTTP